MKGKTKGKQKKETEQEEKKDFKDGPFVGTKKTLKLEENSLSGLFYKTKAQKHREITKPQKKTQK